MGTDLVSLVTAEACVAVFVPVFSTGATTESLGFTMYLREMDCPLSSCILFLIASTLPRSDIDFHMKSDATETVISLNVSLTYSILNQRPNSSSRPFDLYSSCICFSASSQKTR